MPSRGTGGRSSGFRNVEDDGGHVVPALGIDFWFSLRGSLHYRRENKKVLKKVCVCVDHLFFSVLTSTFIWPLPLLKSMKKERNREEEEPTLWYWSKERERERQTIHSWFFPFFFLLLRYFEYFCVSHTHSHINSSKARMAPPGTDEPTWTRWIQLEPWMEGRGGVEPDGGEYIVRRKMGRRRRKSKCLDSLHSLTSVWDVIESMAPYCF